MYYYIIYTLQIKPDNIYPAICHDQIKYVQQHNKTFIQNKTQQTDIKI